LLSRFPVEDDQRKEAVYAVSERAVVGAVGRQDVGGAKPAPPVSVRIPQDQDRRVLFFHEVDVLPTERALFEGEAV